MSRMPDITPGDMVLVGKGLDVKSSFIGPYIVLKTTKQQGRNSEDCVLPRLQRKNRRGFDRKYSSVPFQEG